MLKKSVAAILLAFVAPTLFAAQVQSEGTGVGKHGNVRVVVTFNDGKISAIDVKENHENPILAEKVFTTLKDNIIQSNSVKLDTFSGATISSQGLLKAVQNAAQNAKIKLADAGLKKISEDSVIPAEQTFDVVVIGAGGAGFSAAIEAKMKGANVVILEKMPSVGGNSLISGGEINIPQSWVQEKLGIKGDNPARHIADTLKGGDYMGDPEMVTTMITHAKETGEWLRGVMKVQYDQNYVFQFGGHSIKRALTPVGQTGVEPIKKFSAKAKELGIPVLLNMNATELIKDDSGRVIGVKAVSNGKTYTFNGKGVILATGGFGANKKMVEKYRPDLKGYMTTDAPGTLGEALAMAEKAGAQLVNMNYIQTYPNCDPISGSLQLFVDARFDGGLLINQEGKRFVEELERRDVISNAIVNQPGGYAYVLWNDKINNLNNPPFIKIHESEYDVATKNGVMITANTLKEAADFYKIDAKQLQATIDRVNEMAARGVDEDFHHRAGLVAMKEGKWYMAKTVPAIHHTMGGIKTNTKAEVLDANGDPIPGLYAAGECTGTIHGTNRLGANAWLDITVFRRIAGKNAANLK